MYGLLGQGIGRVMFYPAVSCVLVGSVYLTNQPKWFGKREGTHSLLSMLLFNPYFLGSWCSWFYYSRKIPAWSEVVPGILLGRRLNRDEAREFFNSNSNVAVLDLAPEIIEKKIVRNRNYKYVPILDLAPPCIRQLEEALDFIDSHHTKSNIFIHCTLGLSRGAAVVAAFLIRQGFSMDHSISLIQRSRPQVLVSDALIQILRKFEAESNLRIQVPVQDNIISTFHHKVLQANWRVLT